MNNQEKFRKSVFVVVYRKSEKGTRYLLLKRKLHWRGWEFPKGGIGKNEKVSETIEREIKEETGQIAENIQNHNFSGKYKYKPQPKDREFIGQTFSLYSAEIKNEKIKIDEKEHSDYLWLPYTDAWRKLTYRNQKKSLKIVNDFIGKISKFKNFRTSLGKLVLAGKNEKNNEELIAQIDPEELVFHTKKPGSPFVNLKDKTPNQEDIKESAIFCALKSQDWRDNRSDVIVNMFRGKDIYKTKDMKTGSFGVKNCQTIKIKKEDIEKCQ